MAGASTHLLYAALRGVASSSSSKEFSSSDKSASLVWPVFMVTAVEARPLPWCSGTPQWVKLESPHHSAGTSSARNNNASQTLSNTPTFISRHRAPSTIVASKCLSGAVCRQRHTHEPLFETTVLDHRSTYQRSFYSGRVLFVVNW